MLKRTREYRPDSGDNGYLMEIEANCLSSCVEASAITTWLTISDHLALCFVSRLQYKKLMPSFVMRKTWPINIFHKLSPEKKQLVRKLQIFKKEFPFILSDLHLFKIEVLKLEKMKYFVKNMFPSTLKELKVSETSWKYFNVILPPSLKRLRFDSLSNGFIRNLPELTNLTHLEFPPIGSCPLSELHLPSSIQRLLLNCTNSPRFVSDQDFCLPPNLTHLTLRRFLDPIVSMMFSSTLIEITIGTHNTFAPNTFPDSVKTLNIRKFNHELLPNMLPKSLTVLDIGSFNKHILEPGILPLTLQKLNIDDGFTSLICGLHTELKVLQVFSGSNLLLDEFPPNLEDLVVSCYPTSQCILPPSIQNLTIFRNIINIPLPSSLKSLILFGDYESALVFPPNLENLLINGKNLETFVLPQSITSLTLKLFTSLQLDNLFSPTSSFPSLTSLSFQGINFRLNNVVFPMNLRKIYFGAHFESELPNQGIFPQSLYKLSCLSKLTPQVQNWKFQLLVHTNEDFISIYFF
jgi:hypothetical protein